MGTCRVVVGRLWDLIIIGVERPAIIMQWPTLNGSTIVDRHPWAVMQPRAECETCLRTFVWTEAMGKLCSDCGRK